MGLEDIVKWSKPTCLLCIKPRTHDLTAWKQSTLVHLLAGPTPLGETVFVAAPSSGITSDSQPFSAWSRVAPVYTSVFRGLLLSLC